jgi:hypothetical protein
MIREEDNVCGTGDTSVLVVDHREHSEAEGLGAERQADVDLGLEVDKTEEADQLKCSPTGTVEHSQRRDDGERDAELGADRKQRLQVHVQLSEQLDEQRQLRLGAHVDRDEDGLCVR